MTVTSATTQSGEGVYRLKTVQFWGQECHILLQNENGPCPLLAAANALLLQGKVKLPPAAIRNNVASLSDLTNFLADFAMQSAKLESTTAEVSNSYLLDELLRIIPKLQYGMDVNPKFTNGTTGYEFTQELTCFDSWQVKLVHGWLLDPTDESLADLFQAVGNKTYNELIEHVIQGKEADSSIVELLSQLDQLRQQHPLTLAIKQQIDELEQKLKVLQNDSTRASCIDNFLSTTGHQLTQYGLDSLHLDLKEGEVVVFFRNNHFCTMTKHEGHLYLLVTDLGYANTPMVVWERLDVIDGDTEYVNSQFKQPGEIAQSGSTLTPEQLMAQSSQNDADYNLALHLSMQPHGDQGINANSQAMLDTEEGKLMAAATEASLLDYHGEETLAAQQIGLSSAAFSKTSQESAAPVVPHDGTLGQESMDEMLARQLAKEMAQEEKKQHHLTVDDEQLARQLQQEQGGTILASVDADERLARRLQEQAEEEDARLARQLQQEENLRGAATNEASAQPALPTTRTDPTPQPTQPSSSNTDSQDSFKCVIS